MPAKLTLHPPQRASRFLVLRDGESLVIGRAPGCGLVLEDTRVSKQHALLRWTGRGWQLEDLGSTNGTLVNDKPASGAELRAADWISFGGLLGRFELLTASQAEMLLSERLARLQTSASMRRRLSADLEPVDLLLQFLLAAIKVTQADRGFVLVVGPDGSLHVPVSAGFSFEGTEDVAFRGSVGAVRQALAAGEPVIVAGNASLACLPLRQGAQILGVVYLDSSSRGLAFTQLDIEILEALADHAATILNGHSPARRVRGPAAADAVASQLQRRLQELLPDV